MGYARGRNAGDAGPRAPLHSSIRGVAGAAARAARLHEAAGPGPARTPRCHARNCVALPNGISARAHDPGLLLRPGVLRVTAPVPTSAGMQCEQLDARTRARRRRHRSPALP